MTPSSSTKTELNATDPFLATKDLILEVDLLHQKLAARIGELENLFDCIQVGMGLIDRDLRFLRVNEQLAEINGVSTKDHVGAPVAEILPALVDEIEPYVHKALEGERTLNLEVVSEPPTEPGVRRAWMVSYFPVRDQEGTIFAASTLLLEVTAQWKLKEEALAASAQERDKIGREIHASISQELSGISLLTRASQEKLSAEGHPAAEEIGTILNYLEQVAKKARNVAHSLSPLSLEGRSLEDALDQLASTIAALHPKVSCEASCDSLTNDLPAPMATEAYFVASEAAFNAARHSGASSILIQLQLEEDQMVSLSVVDDGAGQAKHIGANSSGIGLRSIKARAWNLGGSIDIEDNESGPGITVHFRFPLPADFSE
ncbi:MAG: PAS domain-containing protein [Verrucomicrobiota bacterium]